MATEFRPHVLLFFVLKSNYEALIVWKYPLSFRIQIMQKHSNALYTLDLTELTLHVPLQQGWVTCDFVDVAGI